MKPRQASATVNIPLAIVLGALALTALLYWPTSLEIVDYWQDTARRRYTHGWAVLAVTVWLMWRDRAALQTIAVRGSVIGWIGLVVLSTSWLVFYYAALLTPAMLLLPTLALAAIWAAGGMRLAHRAAFAVLCLYFALPIWDAIDLPLQSFTTAASVQLIGLVGIPVYAEGSVLHIPEGSFEIATSCNGLHFVIVALAIATIQGHAERYDWRSRLLLLVLAIVVSVATNLIRVFAVVLAGHLTHMQHFLVRVDHYYFGWVLFAFAMVLYFLLLSFLPLRRREQPARTPPPAGSAGSAELVAIIAAAIGLALGPAYLLAVTQATDDTVAMQPPRLADWSGPEASSWPWQPVYPNADERFLVSYMSEHAGEVVLFRAAYHFQRQGKEVRGYETSVAGPGYFVQSSTNMTPMIGGQPVPVVEQQLLSERGQQLLVWSLYGVGDHPDEASLAARIRYGLRSLIDAPTASVIAIAAECAINCDDAHQAVEDLASLAVPVLLPGIGKNFEASLH
jgi:EpsI family protein